MGNRNFMVAVLAKQDLRLVAVEVELIAESASNLRDWNRLPVDNWNHAVALHARKIIVWSGDQCVRRFTERAVDVVRRDLSNLQSRIGRENQAKDTQEYET
jgi:hypothetical protein